MKILKEIDGFKNRNTVGMPSKITSIKVLIPEQNQNQYYICEWKPFNPKNYTGKTINNGTTTYKDMPGKGYLGTATVVTGEYKGIGFHAWEQNNSEFIYYTEL